MLDIWPFAPRIVARETLSFLTDIRKTRLGEMRDSLRAARRIVDMEFNLDDAQNSLAESMFRAAAASDWLVPVWPELTQFRMPVAAGAIEFKANRPSDYIVGEFAFLCFGDSSYQQVEVLSIGASSITISAPSLIKADAIAPLRVGYITGDLGGARWFKGHAVRSIQVTYREDGSTGETPFSQYNGADLVTDPSVIASPVDAKIISARSLVDNGAGAVVIVPSRDITESMMQLVWKDFGHADIASRKQWFRYLRGRDRSFWLPTWGHDMTLFSSITYNQGFVDIAPLYGSPDSLVGRHIVIDDGNGFLPRRIEAGSVHGAAWRLTIQSTGRHINNARLMFLNRMRLDTDRIEMNLTGVHYMETSVMAIEVQE